MDDPRELMKYRVYYAAKDGMSLVFYALIEDKVDVESLLNEVRNIYLYLSNKKSLLFEDFSRK